MNRSIPSSEHRNSLNGDVVWVDGDADGHGAERENAAVTATADDRNLAQDEQGGTTLEWTLLLAVIGIPSYYVITMLLGALTGQYRMMTLINSLPFP